LLVVLAEQLLQERGQALLSTIGGGHEGRQLGQFQEATQRADAGSALLLEDTTGKGHVSRVIGTADATLAVVQLPENRS